MKKGFSLVEILAVIALLGVILTLASIAVTTFRKNSEENLKKQKIEYIETGALRWGEENLNSLSTTCTYKTVSELISGGYIIGDNDSKDVLLIPGTQESFNNKCVCVKYENIFAGKNLSGLVDNNGSSYHGTTNYQVTASYGEGECN